MGEWDGTKQHDVLFLLTIDPPDAHQLLQIRKEAEAVGGKGAKPSPDKLHGLVRVRGCEVVEVQPCHYSMPFVFPPIDHHFPSSSAGASFLSNGKDLIYPS